MPARALIAGLGLIGGSIGKAIRARGWHVAYVDPNVAQADAASAGAADERREHIGGDFDLVILAAPADVALVQLRTLSAPLTTSVCSVMKPLRDATRTQFVAGHPMAGSHEHGLAAARADLFDGKRWFVDARNELVEQLITDCGAVMDLVDPQEHDEAVAITSHIPQILSTALAAYAGEHDVIRYAGSGLRTFLRLADSDASVWRPVIEANLDAINRHLDELLARVNDVVDGDDAIFDAAHQFSEKLSRG
jgi:prephenate dehydrogenase